MLTDTKTLTLRALILRVLAAILRLRQRRGRRVIILLLGGFVVVLAQKAPD